MAPRLVQKTASLPLRDDGVARLAVVADTHSLPHPETARRIADIAPDAILHAGDIGDLSVLEGLEKLAPLFAVRGNIDTRAKGIPDIVTLDLTRQGERFLRIMMLHIAVYGPRLRADVARKASDEGARLVVCGHSHVPFLGEERGVAVFNPGSVGPRRFQLPILLGRIDVSPERVSFAHIDCETGRPWSPP